MSCKKGNDVEYVRRLGSCPSKKRYRGGRAETQDRGAAGEEDLLEQWRRDRARERNAPPEAAGDAVAAAMEP